MPDRAPALPAAPVPAARHGAVALALVVATSLFHVWYAGAVQLTPPEAYGWQHARHLDLAYLERPPLAAWTVRAAVELLGTSERTVRVGATLHAAIAAAFFFLAGRRLFGPRAALVALAAALATPLFSLGQSVMSPDVPLVAGWCGALYFTIRALEGHGAWLVAAWAAAAWAVLAAYAGWLLAPLLLAALLLDARGRGLLRTPWPWLGLAAAAAILWPALAAGGSGAGLRAQLAGRTAALEPAGIERVMLLLGLQSLLVTPILGGVTWVAAAAAALRGRERPMRLCALFSLPPLALCLALSPFAWARGSWVAVAYPGAILAAAAFLLEAPRERRGIAVVAVASALLGAVYLHAAALAPALPFPAKRVATLGWRELAARVDAERRRLGAGAFVLGCGPEVASALAFYLPERPETYSANAMGEHGPQHAYWLRPEGLVGRSGIVVLDRRERTGCARRAEVCTALERLRPLVVRRKGQPVTTFELWRCRYPDALAAGAGAR